MGQRESDMVGSWAGAMGHTQWMPEVWLNMGADGNGDGRISPFGSPDDAFAGTAQYLLKRGGYRRDEGWGYEVRLPGKARSGGVRTIAAWQKLGVTTGERPAVSAARASRRAFGSRSRAVPSFW